ncbi:hypothetical protein [Synechococcus sp. PCC 6312]|uniref:hypothetical protein n=1 Tax=Synechococcus sp. (strain ATCC 27167 / PCC 6312) TaxID=195253 RepID=UPI00029EC749|nr:hypothetical protein [Synechococcus sp. PCC 6312]AFY60334.1 hypothetical protein Syn6312_1145 [Synechococcus sp. PCC 6312]
MLIEQYLDRLAAERVEWEVLCQQAYSPEEKQVVVEKIRDLLAVMRSQREWLQAGLKSVKEKEQGL